MNKKWIGLFGDNQIVFANQLQFDIVTKDVKDYIYHN
jgi:hypothetical protein